ncbi:MAG: DNRLRE domain-containing protein, partial [Methanosarcinales archaeon]
VSAIVTNENGSDIQTWMWSVKDITPPSSIKNLQNKTGLTWINWTWNNPSDQDFNHTMIYLDGVFKINTSLNYYNATSLTPNTTHTISTHTVDKYGNINATWINQTTSTLEETGKVSGWVIDEEGKPIKKANISLNGTSISTETDKNGYYFLTAPVGNYTITASYKKHENQSKNITLIKDQTIIVNFTLIKHVSGKGKVVDDDDKPLNLSIKVRGPDGKWIHIKDDANEFDWDDLPNGSEIIFDALDIKNVSAKFKIYDNATNAVIKLDKYANNPEPSNPPGTSIKYVKVNATNVSYEKVEISISYTDAELGGLNENNLKILHYKNGKWNELATSVDKANNTITATTTSLSTFAVIQPSGADTYVREDQSTTNYGTAPNMYVRSKTGSRSHAFIKFDLSSIPRGSNIISANLSLYMYTAPTASRTYNIYKITSDWNETTITWNNAPTVSATPTSSSSTGTTNNVWLNWSVTSDVQYFLDNPSNNYGWMINDSSEGSADYFANFSSKENATSSLRPKIYVEYKIPPYRAKVYVIKTRSYDQREAARNGNISYYYSGPSATFMVDPTNWSDAYYFDILDGNNVDYWWYPKATIRVLLLDSDGNKVSDHVLKFTITDPNGNIIRNGASNWNNSAGKPVDGTAGDPDVNEDGILLDNVTMNNLGNGTYEYTIQIDRDLPDTSFGNYSGTGKYSITIYDYTNNTTAGNGYFYIQYWGCDSCHEKQNFRMSGKPCHYCHTQAPPATEGGQVDHFTWLVHRTSAGASSVPEHSTTSESDCKKCHQNYEHGSHTKVVGGCANTSCHGTITQADGNSNGGIEVNWDPDCRNCHKNTSIEGSSLASLNYGLDDNYADWWTNTTRTKTVHDNISNAYNGPGTPIKAHTHPNNTEKVECGFCHNAMHATENPSPSEDINGMCWACHDASDGNINGIQKTMNCKNCHVTNGKVDAHYPARGGGPNCISCHGKGGSATH